WRVEDGTTLIWGDYNPDDETNYGMGYPIAECRLTPSASWAIGPRTYEEAEAIARLIAAPPDMLEALRSAVASLEQLVAIDCIPANNKGLREARAAIAKAEGQS